MNLPAMIEDLETRVVKTLGISRLKNQIVGNSWMAGLKAVSTILTMPKPTVLMGKDSSIELADTISQFGLKSVLVVTDPMLHQLGILDKMLESFKESGTKVTLFTEVEPDPTFKIVESGLKAYKRGKCDSVLAVGGGSSIDAAKVIALTATNGGNPQAMVGLFKGRKPSAPFFAVPTTAGTGSEATIGAVISDTETHKKQLVIDTKIVPMMASLDPELMRGLPAPITAATGIDALTHLVEGYTSGLATEETSYYARSGIKLVFDNLRNACKKNASLKSREKLSMAAYYGGLTINTAGLGYCHAFAHQLGAHFQIPHGEANAKVLPHVMDYHKATCQAQYADLARLIGVGKKGDSEAKLANAFIAETRKLITDIGIDPTVPQLKNDLYLDIIKSAFKEANSTYAVPKYMSHDEAEQLLDALKGPSK